MGSCDLCGREGGLIRAKVEGSILSVCKNCAKMGSPLASHQAQGRSREVFKDPIPKEDQNKAIVKNYGEIIHSKREKMKLTQKDFAKTINVKESQLQKMENNEHEPSIDLARRLEKALNVILVEEVKEAVTQTKKGVQRPQGMTIGDIIKFKTKS